jgi:hypothetical protein
MKKGLERGDLFIIKSLDRLGCSYKDIIKEWNDITKAIGADFKVLNNAKRKALQVLKIKAQSLVKLSYKLIVLTLGVYINNGKVEKLKVLKMTKATFYRRVKEYEDI